MAKTHILLVDNEVDFVETMSFLLRARGYEVSTAFEGKEALKKAKQKPDLILLDITMPGMSGYEVCDKLRRNTETQHIPIIMLTVKEATGDKVEGLQVGADDYIIKTLDNEEMFARIEAVLRRSGFRKEEEEDTAALISELKHIIQKELVKIFFQPIYYLSPRRLLGYEVLTSGPQKSYFKDAVKLFKFALSKGMIFELETLCRKKALARLKDLPEDILIFFNCNAYLVGTEQFEKILEIHRRPEQIVLEITERAEVRDFKVFNNSLKTFRNKGFKVSIDDVGSGYSSLDIIAEAEPDFAKIDINIVREVNSNKKKQNLIKAIDLLCRQNNVTSIGEGIETEEELKALIKLGINAGQGFLLGRPEPEPIR